MKKGIILSLLTIVIWSCETNDNPFSNLTTEDREIVDKAYSKTYMYPTGFNFQQNLDGSLYYENTVSIRTSQTSWIELSTNDKQQAKDWSETSSSTSAYYRDLVAERETEKYFEFKRVYSLNTKDVILSRVHKSTYFIPSFDKRNPSSTIGTLKENPINEETTKDFIEYMWTSYMIGYTEKVLEYTITDYPDKVKYNLKSVNVTYGDFGLCDVIEVKNFDFFVDKQSGAVTFESNKIKEIKGTCR
jgi:Mg2+ and Co2+ transporter CorA